MKNLKKVLALVVALTMVFTTVAFASYPDVDATADYAGAVELLSALDILKGDDNGNFNPDNTITRAEFAAVVCRALGWETSANGAKGTTQFTDVAADHWASGYINLAAQQSIINGKGNGIFDPEGNVTFTEAVKMLVVAIGYNPMAEQKGGWPTGYLTVANSIKMTAGVAATGTDAAALRSTVAQLTANAIEIPVMDQVSYGTLTEFKPLNGYSNYKTLLTAMDVHMVTGVVLDVDEAAGEFEFQVTMPSDDYEFGYLYNSVTGDLSVQLVNKVFDIADSNVIDYIGQNVNIYVKEVRKDTDYECIVCMPSGIGDTLTIGLDKITATAANPTTIRPNAVNTYEYYESNEATRTEKFYVVANPTIKVNGVLVNTNGHVYTPAYTDQNGQQQPATDRRDVNDLFMAAWTGSNARNVEFTFTENTNDKYFDIIDINIVDYAIVANVLADKERIEFVNGSKITFDAADDEQIVTIYNAEGAEIALEDIEEGDVLALQVSEIDSTYSDVLPVPYGSFTKKITVYDLGQSIVTGTVTGWDNENHYLYIDGEKYEYSRVPWVTDDDYAALIATGDPLGVDGAFYLGKDNKIIGYDGTQGGAGNYGFIVDAYMNRQSFEPQWQLKVLTVSDGLVTYNVKTKCDIYNGPADRGTFDLATNPAAQDPYFNFSADPTYATSNKYVNTPGATVDNRVIDFDVNKNGEIDDITFVYAMTNTRPHTITAPTDEYKASTNKLGGKEVEDTIVIFNVKTPDILDATVLDASSLVDEGVYGGRLYDVNNDKQIDVFVMQDGVAAFDAEANFFVVESVANTTYGEDAEDAILVNYYVEGSNELLQAYITDDSHDALTENDWAYRKGDLARGSIFVANVSENGLVSEYAVIAKVVSGRYLFNARGNIQQDSNGNNYYAGALGDLHVLTEKIYGKSEVDQRNTKDEKAEFVYGYITNIKGKTLTLGGRIVADSDGNYVAKNVTGGRDFAIDAGVAQYCYNMDNISKPRVVAGDYRSRNVDVYIDGNSAANPQVPATASLVLLKVYDGEVTDIVSISGRKNVAYAGADLGILAQTHFGSYNNANNSAELSAVETEVEVEVKEEIVEVEEIVFE